MKRSGEDLDTRMNEHGDTYSTDFPNKWYKMEEARGETFLWHELRKNFIKDFNFISQN